MATLRTYEEKTAIVEHCIELEKSGGDILGYLWSENYVTPRATWCNIQREWLGRKPYEFTDGKPVKGVKKMKHFKLTPEIRAEAIRLAIAGEDPREYLTKIGSENAPKKWMQIRAELKDSDPETYGKLPARIGSRTKKASEAISADVAKKSAVKPLELEAGTNYQLSVAEVPEKPVSMSVVTPPPQKASFGGYDVTAISHPDLGEFYHDVKYGTIDWRHPSGEEISLTPDGWRKLMAAIPQMMGILGVKV